MSVIRDGQQHFGATLAQIASGPMRAFAERQGVAVATLDLIATSAPAAVARIDHSRLIADCPDCGGAEFVWRDGPHLMMCQSCWNMTIGGMWRRVALSPLLPEVEAILAARPLPQNRNWTPGETVEALRAENAEHGV